MKPEHEIPWHTAIRYPRRVRASVFSLFVGCMVFCLSAPRAEATCGDYLAHHGKMAFSHLSAPIGMMPVEPVPHGKRCHGPSCRQAPLQTPIPVPVVTFEAQDRWVILPSLQFETTDEAGIRVGSTQMFVPTVIAFRLDRPPKL